MPATERKYKSFKNFYPFYLTEHSLPINRVLHFCGTFLVISITTTVCICPRWWMLLVIPVAGYGFAWTGHFVFEKNKPATFKYPLYSLVSDFLMFFHIITGQIGKKMQEAHQSVHRDRNSTM